MLCFYTVRINDRQITPYYAYLQRGRSQKTQGASLLVMYWVIIQQ